MAHDSFNPQQNTPQKIFGMYLQAKHTSKAAFYLLQQSGIVPRYNCIRKIKNIAEEAKKQMVLAAVEKPGLILRMSPENPACLFAGFAHVLARQKTGIAHQGNTILAAADYQLFQILAKLQPGVAVQKIAKSAPAGWSSSTRIFHKLQPSCNLRSLVYGKIYNTCQDLSAKFVITA